MADARITQRAFTLPVRGTDRLCLVREPARGAPRGIVVHVPAFAEEMNKSRRMTAWCARELAASGFRVVQIDLFGCGDSAGDFGDASWDAWVEDIHAAVRCVRPADDVSLCLWGLRLGALLACAALPALPRDTSMVFWQPVLSGQQHLAQFLRLAVAADVLAAEAGRTPTRQLRDRLLGGNALEIAGYALAPELARGIDAARLQLPAGFAGPIMWLEVAAMASDDMSPASLEGIVRLRTAGAEVSPRVVSGPRFWQTVEIEDCPALIDATVEMVSSCCDDRLDRAATAV